MNEMEEPGEFEQRLMAFLDYATRTVRFFLAEEADEDDLEDVAARAEVLLVELTGDPTLGDPRYRDLPAVPTVENHLPF